MWPIEPLPRRLVWSVRTVASYRARNNISGFKGTKRRSRPGPRSKVEPFANLVGKVPDRVIADKAGITVNAVRNWRRIRGIQAAGRGGGPGRPVVVPPPAAVPPLRVKAPPAPVAVAAVPTSGIAWQVELQDGKSGIVVAETLAAAALRAESVGSVQSITRLANIL